jgi:hypothetical protein
MHLRRQFVRIPFQTGAVLTFQGKSHEATLIDLSLTGALVHCQTVDAPLGDCRLAFPLSAEVLLSFRVEVLHGSHGQLGCRFTGMSPATFSHLVRLLELNSGDGGQIERELQNLARQPHLTSAAAHLSN